MDITKLSDQKLKELQSKIEAEVHRRTSEKSAQRAIYQIPVEETSEGSPICLSESCPLIKACANHESAGDFRTEDGFTPNLHKINGNWKCEQKETRASGMLISSKGRLISYKPLDHQN